MIWSRMRNPMTPVMHSYDRNGPMGDYLGLIDIHELLFAMPRMERASASIPLSGWTVDDEVRVEWEGEPWWSGKGRPEPVERLSREAKLYRFDMPPIADDDEWVQTIRLDVGGLEIEVQGKTPRPSYHFHLRREEDRWTEGCTVRLRHPVTTDLVHAVGSADLSEVLGHYGLHFAGGCPLLGHRFQDDIIEATTTTIVMAALRNDTQHHRETRP